MGAPDSFAFLCQGWRLGSRRLDVEQKKPYNKAIMQSDLVVASNVKQASGRVTADSSKDLKQDEAARLLEQALFKPAGVIITRLDGKRASVT